MKLPNPKLISFRDEIKEISNTNYLTHSLYFHPAKFIPQIVKYCLDNYSIKGGKILDPFAGSGTTGLEAEINGYKSVLTDINPMVEYFYKIKFPQYSIEDWSKCVEETEIEVESQFNVSLSKDISLQNEKRLEYWYPDDLLNYFSKIWNNINKLQDGIKKSLITLIFFKLSKKYSFAEHSMPKLFISKRKRKFIDELERSDNFGSIIVKEAKKDIIRISKAVRELLAKVEINNVVYFSGVDSYTFEYDKTAEIDCIITSPPYLQAQEYIRTFKLEMIWAGFTEDEVKNYAKKEIPFRKTEGIIDGRYINEIRKKVGKKSLTEMFDSYFWFTIKSLENAAKSLKKGSNLCVLVGNPLIGDTFVEIWKVIYEYFTEVLNYSFVELIEDRIVSRKLFGGRNNNNPDGMKSEFLIVLKK